MAKKRPKTYYEKRQERLIDTLQNLFTEFGRILDGLILERLYNGVSNLDIDDKGRFVFGIRNISRAQRVGLEVTGIFEGSKKTLLERLVGQIKRLIRWNRNYYDSYNEFSPESVEDKVSRLVLARLGYDIEKDQLVPGGWLDGIFGGSPVGGQVARDLLNAVSGRMDQKEFIKQFRGLFTGNGYAARHFKTFAFDFFQVVDRQTKYLFALELGLTFARYAGTAEKDTRDFCLERLNLIYSFDEIDTWESLEWKGKLKVGHNLYIHCGGHNCRHHWAYLDAQAVELLKQRGTKVNQYNTIVHNV
jgi:hypothetical protein